MQNLDPRNPRFRSVQYGHLTLGQHRYYLSIQGRGRNGAALVWINDFDTGDHVRRSRDACAQSSIGAPLERKARGRRYASRAKLRRGHVTPSLKLELHFVEPALPSVGAVQQLIVRALLDQPAVVDHEQARGAAQGGEPVRDREHGPPPRSSGASGRP